MPDAERLRDSFWEERAARPHGVTLERLESHVIPSRGRSGRWLVDTVRLTIADTSRIGVMAYAPRLVPGDAQALADRLSAVVDTSLAHRFASQKPSLRFAVVERATSALISSCRDARLGIVDLGGGVFVSDGPLILRIEGTRPVARAPRASPFSSVGRRVVRALLLQLDAPPTVTGLSQQLGASYASVSGCLRGLEKLGYVTLSHGRPPTLRRLRELAVDWAEQAPALVTEGFYCGDTTPVALTAGIGKLAVLGSTALFTWRSGLLDSEVMTSGIPHAVRSAASTALLQEAFSLRRVTPHNFFIVRAEPGEDTDAGGVRMAPRTLDWGPGVSPLQLASDLLKSNERGREQGAHVLDAWLSSIPPRPLND